VKHKVSELEGAWLDFAVAKALGHPGIGITSDIPTQAWATLDGKTVYSPSTDWSIAGPIIERERITVEALPELEWRTSIPWPSEECRDWRLFFHGPTPLIAAMRAYVASKYGKEIELP
jgi:hypothetical protein